MIILLNNGLRRIGWKENCWELLEPWQEKQFVLKKKRGDLWTCRYSESLVEIGEIKYLKSQVM